jgi:putative DNA primase/helicase
MDELPPTELTHMIHAIAAGLPPTSDYAMASDFCAQFHRVIKRSKDTGRWYFYDGVRWRLDAKDRVERLCNDWTAAKANQIADQLKSTQAETPMKADKIGKTLSSAATMKAVWTVVSKDPRIQVEHNDWDTDPWVLGTPSGWVDLRTGILHPATPEKLILKATAVDPAVGLPRRFIECMNTWFGGDQRIIGYIQRLIGYALTGLSVEHVFPFFYGQGGNGKSAFLDLMRWLFGDYGCGLDISYLQDGPEQHSTGFAALAGKRLVITNENEHGKRLKLAKIKELTGGDRLTARHMRCDPIELIPTWTFVMVGNARPQFATTDPGLARRLQLLAWNAVIDALKRDTRLLEALKEEGPQILHWFIQGTLKWQQEGLNPPQSVIDESATHLEAMDPIDEWMREKCVIDASLSQRTMTLYEDFRDWSEARGFRPTNIQRFSMRMIDKGFRRETDPATRQSMMLGVRLSVA